jgi:hypothetical protein
MVKLNNLLTTISLSLLSVSSVSAFNPLVKRYENSTSCEIETTTTTSIVNVYGPSFTGVPSNEYTTPAVAPQWNPATGPVFQVMIPQQLYNLTGLELTLQTAVNVHYDASSYTLLTGDVGQFVNPGPIYSTTNNGLIFNGRTQDPLLEINVVGTADQGVADYVAIFELVLDEVPSIALPKRELTTITLSASIANPNFVSSTISSTDSSSTSATATDSSSTSGTSTGSSTSGSNAASTDASSSTVSTTGTTTGTTNGTSGSGSDSTTVSSSGVSSGTTGTDSVTGAGSTSSSTSGAGAVTTGKNSDSTAAGSASSVSVSGSAPAAGSTVVVGSTIVQTITSCSDNACTEHKVTAIGSVVYTTVGEFVTSYTTYCAVAVDQPSARPYVSISKTVTVGDLVTVVETICPVTQGGKVETTITNANGVSSVVTLTEFATVTATKGAVTNAAQPTTQGQAKTTAVQPGVTVPVQATTNVPQQTGSTSVSPNGHSVSVFEGVAAGRSGYLTGGIFGIVGLFMML